MRSTLSVALGTMNCAAYLPAQLASLLAQTRLPDELVVGDEASTDGTWAILEAFAARAPFPVHLVRNPTRLGVAANYSGILARCTGSLIALCDHDDVWEPGRLAAAEQAIQGTDVSLAFSDASLIDAAGQPIPGTLWGRLGLDAALQARLAGAEPAAVFATLVARRLVTGGTMTLRREDVCWMLPIPEGFYQDEWLALLAPLRGRLAPIAQPLMRYRQHASNSVGAQADGIWPRLRRARDGQREQRLAQQARQLRLLLEQLAGKPGLPAWAVPLLRERLAHVEARAAVGQGRAGWLGPLGRVPRVWAEWRTGRYAGDAMGTWSAWQDLLG